MMLYPPMADLVDKVGSRYMLVNWQPARNRSQKPFMRCLPVN